MKCLETEGIGSVQKMVMMMMRTAEIGLEPAILDRLFWGMVLGDRRSNDFERSRVCKSFNTVVDDAAMRCNINCMGNSGMVSIAARQPRVT